MVIKLSNFFCQSNLIWSRISRRSKNSSVIDKGHHFWPLVLYSMTMLASVVKSLWNQRRDGHVRTNFMCTYSRGNFCSLRAKLSCILDAYARKPLVLNTPLKKQRNITFRIPTQTHFHLETVRCQHNHLILGWWCIDASDLRNRIIAELECQSFAFYPSSH
jgi:hypothetical protein